MLFRWVFIISFLFSPFFVVAVEAQGTKEVVYDPPPITVALPVDQPLVAWVADTHKDGTKDIGTIVVFIQDQSGNFITLTPCETADQICQGVDMELEDVKEGEQFFLDLEPK